jgi:hypothetical protein
MSWPRKTIHKLYICIRKMRKKKLSRPAHYRRISAAMYHVSKEQDLLYNPAQNSHGAFLEPMKVHKYSAAFKLGGAVRRLHHHHKLNIYLALHNMSDCRTNEIRQNVAHAGAWSNDATQILDHGSEVYDFMHSCKTNTPLREYIPTSSDHRPITGVMTPRFTADQRSDMRRTQSSSVRAQTGKSIKDA